MSELKRNPLVSLRFDLGQWQQWQWGGKSSEPILIKVHVCLAHQPSEPASPLCSLCSPASQTGTAVLLIFVLNWSLLLFCGCISYKWYLKYWGSIAHKQWALFRRRSRGLVLLRALFQDAFAIWPLVNYRHIFHLLGWFEHMTLKILGRSDSLHSSESI